MTISSFAHVALETSATPRGVAAILKPTRPRLFTQPSSSCDPPRARDSLLATRLKSRVHLFHHEAIAVYLLW